MNMAVKLNDGYREGVAGGGVEAAGLSQGVLAQDYAAVVD